MTSPEKARSRIDLETASTDELRATISVAERILSRRENVERIVAALTGAGWKGTLRDVLTLKVGELIELLEGYKLEFTVQKSIRGISSSTPRPRAPVCPKKSWGSGR